MRVHESASWFFPNPGKRGRANSKTLGRWIPRCTLGTLPEVTGERASTEQSSWQYLLKDLNEEGHCAGELMEQIWAVAPDYPDIAMLLERVSKDEKKHRDEIRDMLARSDAFSGSLA